MGFEDWEKNPDGSIKVCPVVGWDSFIPFGMACGLRIHYASDAAQLASGSRESLPLVLTSAQARELAGVLDRLADKAESPAPAGETGH
jgi:hypothetical protein